MTEQFTISDLMDQRTFALGTDPDHWLTLDLATGIVQTESSIITDVAVRQQLMLGRLAIEPGITVAYVDLADIANVHALANRTKSVNQYIKLLRSKLGGREATPYIENVFGVGYCAWLDFDPTQR